MRLSDTAKWGVRGIRQRKFRSVLTILGIMIGTAAVIALVSQTQGIQYSIIGQISKLGPSTISVRPASSSTVLTDSDVQRISQMPGVEYVIPVVTSSVKVYGSGSARSFSLVGIEPSQLSLLVTDFEIEEGIMYQSLSYSDVVVGYNVRHPQDLSAPFLSVGQSVTAEFRVNNPARKMLHVVGSLNPYGAAALVSLDDSVFMSLKGAQSMLGRSTYSALFVKAIDTESVDVVQENLKAVYGTNLNILTVRQLTQIVSSITGQLTVLLGAVAAISLFVAGLGIMNIMFVSVIERTREIGVLKAVGFKGRDVLSIFLSEAAMLGIIGGALGLLLGTGLSYVIPYAVSQGFSSSSAQAQGLGANSGFAQFSYSPMVSPEIVIFVFLFAVGVSLIAGFYPARRASKMDPVVALRHE